MENKKMVEQLEKCLFNSARNSIDVTAIITAIDYFKKEDKIDTINEKLQELHEAINDLSKHLMKEGKV